MELRKTFIPLLAAGALAFPSSGVFAQNATTGGGTGSTGNESNNPAVIQQDTTGSTAGSAAPAGTGSTGNESNNPVDIQNCPGGKAAMKNAAGKMACQ